MNADTIIMREIIQTMANLYCLNVSKTRENPFTLSLFPFALYKIALYNRQENITYNTLPNIIGEPINKTTKKSIKKIHTKQNPINQLNGDDSNVTFSQFWVPLSVSYVFVLKNQDIFENHK